MNELKQRIHELVPELLELKFGCEVIWDRDVRHPLTILYVEKDARYAQAFNLLSDDLISGDSDNIKTILGSSITLPIVLRAMIANHYYPKMETSGFSVVFFESGNEDCIAIWNLAKDRLEYQSPEFIAFLKSILGV